MLVVIGSDRHIERVADIVAVAENLLLVLGFDIVPRGETVAPKCIIVEVSVGEAEVALIRTLLCRLQLQFDPMCGVARCVAKLDCVILYIETRVIIASVDVLKAIGQPLVCLQQIAKT